MFSHCKINKFCLTIKESIPKAFYAKYLAIKKHKRHFTKVILNVEQKYDFCHPIKFFSKFISDGKIKPKRMTRS